MKTIILCMLAFVAISFASCSSENKDTTKADSVVDTSMSASPGLDTNGVGTDTTTMDTTMKDTTNSSQRPK